MKILLIDNDLASINNLKDAIEPGGHKCVLFQNPKEGLSAYKKDKFDVVITDFKMPEIDGIEVLKTIRAQSPNVYVILLTGYADIENAIDSVNYGAHAYFRKPVKLKGLLEVISKIENEIKNNNEKKVNIDQLAIEYNRLRQAFESLQDVVEKFLPMSKRKL